MRIGYLEFRKYPYISGDGGRHIVEIGWRERFHSLNLRTRHSLRDEAVVYKEMSSRNTKGIMAAYLVSSRKQNPTCLR